MEGALLTTGIPAAASTLTPRLAKRVKAAATDEENGVDVVHTNVLNTNDFIESPPLSRVTAVNRGAAADVVPLCHEHDTGVIVYSPMQAGLLTGSFSVERVAALAEDDWRKRAERFQGEAFAANLAFVDVPRQARVRTNAFDVACGSALYRTDADAVVQYGTRLRTGTAAVAPFGPDALVEAIRADQAGETTFPEFFESIGNAGVVRYDVDPEAPTCTYQGANRGSNVERYPAVGLPVERTSRRSSAWVRRERLAAATAGPSKRRRS